MPQARCSRLAASGRSPEVNPEDGVHLTEGWERHAPEFTFARESCLPASASAQRRQARRRQRSLARRGETSPPRRRLDAPAPERGPAEGPGDAMADSSLSEVKLRIAVHRVSTFTSGSWWPLKRRCRFGWSKQTTSSRTTCGRWSNPIAGRGTASCRQGLRTDFQAA